MFRHAPVSATSMAVCALASFVVSRSPATSGRRHDSGLAWAHLPFPLAGVSDLVCSICVLVVLFHLRALERRWGSASFLTFMLWIAAVNWGVLALFGAARFGTVSALTVPVVALATRHYLEMPALGTSRVFGRIAITDKFLLLGSVGKLLLFPGPHIGESSLFTRLALAALGVAASYVARRVPSFAAAPPPPSTLQRALESVERRVVQPLWDKLLSVPFRQSLAVPRVVRRKPMPRVNPEAVPEDVLRQIAAMEGAAGGRGSATQRGPAGRAPQTGPHTPAIAPQPSPQAARGRAAPDTAAVQSIEGLQLGASREEIVHALEIAGGSVDGAVAILLGGM